MHRKILIKFIIFSTQILEFLCNHLFREYAVMEDEKLLNQLHDYEYTYTKHVYAIYSHLQTSKKN